MAEKRWSQPEKLAIINKFFQEFIILLLHHQFSPPQTNRQLNSQGQIFFFNIMHDLDSRGIPWISVLKRRKF